MVSDDSEARGNLLQLRGYYFQLAARDILYAPTPEKIAQTKVCYIAMEHWMKRETAQRGKKKSSTSKLLHTTLTIHKFSISNIYSV